MLGATVQVRCLGVELAQDGDARGDAQAVSAGLDHGLGVGEGANAARGLHAEVGSDGLAHEAHVLDGGAAGGEAGGGLHKVRAALDGETARADLLLLGEQAALDDEDVYKRQALACSTWAAMELVKAS